MGQKVTMNESQLREKVYNMVCESLEAIMNEGKTFKDQKSWNKKGFQKSNKFQKNDKYQNWKNGGNMNSDQDECMNEGNGKEELGYSVIEKGNGDYPKKVKLNGKEGLDKLYKSKQFIQKNK